MQDENWIPFWDAAQLASSSFITFLLLTSLIVSFMTPRIMRRGRRR